MSKHVYDKFVQLIDAPDSRKLTPALAFADQVLDLPDEQLRALRALLTEFQENPRTSGVLSLQHALAKLDKR
jgi:hypothetical protein